MTAPEKRALEIFNNFFYNAFATELLSTGLGSWDVKIKGQWKHGFTFADTANERIRAALKNV